MIRIAADLLERVFVRVQRGPITVALRPSRMKIAEKLSDEQQARDEHAPDPHALLQVARRDADHGREVAGHERQHARREERDEPGGDRDRDADARGGVRGGGEPSSEWLTRAPRSAPERAQLARPVAARGARRARRARAPGARRRSRFSGRRDRAPALGRRRRQLVRGVGGRQRPRPRRRSSSSR